MPWSQSRPNGGKVNPKYRTPEHRREVAEHRAALARAGSGVCAEIVCLKRSRLILPGMALDLCHERATGRTLGLGHRQCNRSEASKYARRQQDATRLSI